MRTALLGIVVLTLSGAASADDTLIFRGPYLGQIPPDSIPIEFAPGFFPADHNAHSGLAFTPEGTEVYWSAYYKPPGRSRTQHIFFSRMEKGIWTAPSVAPFSGQYNDGGPVISPDGRRLFFYSNRPAVPDGQPSDEYIPDIWFMTRIASGWGEPSRLGFNTDKQEGAMSVSEDGTLYFMSNRVGSQGIFDVYRSVFRDSQYAAPVNVGRPINTPHLNFSPCIAPDESYMIVSYANRPAGNGLHVSFKKSDGTWTDPVSLGSTVNSGLTQRFPVISPDGRYLFFTRSVNRRGAVYWVDTGVIEKLRPKE